MEDRKNNKQKERLLKVYYRNFPRSSYSYAKLSEIRLAGKWLEACGFEVGRFIHVRPLNNTIVITLLDESRPDEKPGK